MIKKLIKKYTIHKEYISIKKQFIKARKIDHIQEKLTTLNNLENDFLNLQGKLIESNQFTKQISNKIYCILVNIDKERTNSISTITIL